MPDNTIYVGRPTKWGNPFPVKSTETRGEAVKAYELWLDEQLSCGKLDLDELRGSDLACWCPLFDKDGKPIPCHADILLRRLE